jgi:hypothetical protein
MGKPVVHEYRAGQREDLCLILQPAKGGRKDDTVIIAEERIPDHIAIARLIAGIACAPRSIERSPIHVVNIVRYLVYIVGSKQS